MVHKSKIQDELFNFWARNLGKKCSSAEIKNAVFSEIKRIYNVEVSLGSIIPSDHAVNMINSGGGVFESLYFQNVRNGVYRCVNYYEYSGDVVWNPNGISGEFVVASWSNGELKVNESIVPQVVVYEAGVRVLSMLDKVKQKMNESQFGGIPDGDFFLEGKNRTINCSLYERNINARARCLEHFGYTCRACNFDFEKVYGELGKDFIHVHHIVPISQRGEESVVNPQKDLIPVCPNCHAMIHRNKEPLDIDALKKMIAENKK
jgi:5-methylcytosine-specific restriction protein A